jgi:hypothetical protein
MRTRYLVYRNSNDPTIKVLFKKYCRILAKVIITAKKSYFNKLLLKSNNKTKTTWNIVKSITNNKGAIENVTPMNLTNKSSGNSRATANAFNDYFSSVADKLLIKTFLGKLWLIIKIIYLIYSNIFINQT